MGKDEKTPRGLLGGRAFEIGHKGGRVEFVWAEMGVGISGERMDAWSQ